MEDKGVKQQQIYYAVDCPDYACGDPSERQGQIEQSRSDLAGFYNRLSNPAPKASSSSSSSSSSSDSSYPGTGEKRERDPDSASPIEPDSKKQASSNEAIHEEAVSQSSEKKSVQKIKNVKSKTPSPADAVSLTNTTSPEADTDGNPSNMGIGQIK